MEGARDASKRQEPELRGCTSATFSPRREFWARHYIADLRKTSWALPFHWATTCLPSPTRIKSRIIFAAIKIKTEWFLTKSTLWILGKCHHPVPPQNCLILWSYLTGCLISDPTDNPLDALHPHLQLHPPLVAPHCSHRLYLPQVAANYPRPTSSRSLGLAPCYSPHLQLLVLSSLTVVTYAPSLSPPLTSFPLTLTTLTPLILLLLLSSNHYRRSPPPPCAQPRPLTSPQPSRLMCSGIWKNGINPRAELRSSTKSWRHGILVEDGLAPVCGACRALLATCRAVDRGPRGGRPRLPCVTSQSWSRVAHAGPGAPHNCHIHHNCLKS